MPDTPIAPAAPAAPAPKPAPVQKPAPVERAEPQTTVDTSDMAIGDAIDSIVKASVSEAVKASEETPADQPRGADGKFAPKDGAAKKDVNAQPTAVVPELKLGVVDELESEGEAEPELIVPEGFVAPATTSRALKTAFKLLDADGTELEVPEVTIAFRANGKERTATLDHVVKMAEWGVYNQEREQQWEQRVRRADQVEQTNQQLMAYARQVEQERDQLLTDDNAYLRARARHEALNTPQAQLERARAETVQAQERAQLTQIHAQGAQFFNGELMPAVQTITKALPLVSDEEIGAKLLLISDRYKVQTPYGAVIPPNQYDAIRREMISDVVPWAQSLNDARDHDRQAATKDATTKATQAEAKTRTAQIDAQKAKSLVGRVTRPGGRGGATTTSTRDAAKPAPIRTVEDAEQAAIRETLDAMRHAG